MRRAPACSRWLAALLAEFRCVMLYSLQALSQCNDRILHVRNDAEVFVRIQYLRMDGFLPFGNAPVDLPQGFPAASFAASEAFLLGNAVWFQRV